MMKPNLPWYDSPWLKEYRRARAWLLANHRAKVDELDALVSPLRTRQDFAVTHLSEALDLKTFAEMRDILSDVAIADISFEDMRNFGRFIQRN